MFGVRIIQAYILFSNFYGNAYKFLVLSKLLIIEFYYDAK